MSARAKTPQNARKLADNWLGKLGISDGDWISATSKLKLRRGMKARCLGEAGRVWCCLGLATDAFKSERAVKQVGERIVDGDKIPMLAPLQLVDIAAMTGLKKQNVRRAIDGLKAWGLADIQGEGKDIVVFVWVIPRDVNVEAIEQTGDPLAEVPAELRTYFRRFKILPAPGFRLAYEEALRIEEAAKAYISASDALKAAIKACGARDYSPVIPRERKDTPRDDAIQMNGNEREKNQEPSSSSSSLDAPKEPSTTITPRWPLASAALRQVATADDQAIEDLARKCREIRPECIDAEIAYVVDAKAKVAAKKDNPVGFLLTAAPNLFRGEGYAHVRKMLRQLADEEERRKVAQETRAHNAAEQVLAYPEASEEDRAWAREVLDRRPGNKASP